MFRQDFFRARHQSLPSGQAGVRTANGGIIRIISISIPGISGPGYGG